MASIRTYSQPSRLYRYRPLNDQKIERELRSIADGNIYCPLHKQLNDPMEGAHSESALLQRAESYQVSKAEVEGALNQLGIASFSETNMSEPMWAHYADEFRGICIAYNFRKLLAELSDEHQFVKMAYNERPPVLLKDRKSADERARMVLSTKALRWAPEREWRLIRATSGPAEYRSQNCISAIYMGSRIDQAHVRAIRRAISTTKIPLYSMKIDQYEIAYTTNLVIRRITRDAREKHA